MPLSPVTRVSLGLGGLVVFTGGVAALAHDDWITGLFLVALGIVCLLSTFTEIDARRSASSRGLATRHPTDVRHAQGAHTPPTVPWRDHDRTA